ncbi:MAG: hypothetical protein LBE78_03700 [Burkholderiaceae bacterium]|nr:hypothetical protein [Burkholderiaceae bacterium]
MPRTDVQVEWSTDASNGAEFPVSVAAADAFFVRRKLRFLVAPLSRRARLRGRPSFTTFLVSVRAMCGEF